MSKSVVPPGELHTRLHDRLARFNSDARPRPKAKKHPRGRIRAKAAAVFGAAALLVAMVSIAAGTDYIDLTSAGAEVTDSNGGVWIQGGIGAGTGNFDPFLTLSTNQDTEKGVNVCDDTGCPSPQFDTFTGGGRTHELLISAVPEINYLGNMYREFTLDANDQGSDDWMSIDAVEIYKSTNVNLTGYPFSVPADAQLMYQLPPDTFVQMRSQSLSPGSGVSDITLLVPDNVFPADCFYGSLTCNEYLFFYTESGGLGNYGGHNYNVTAGFEEWRVSLQPVVNVTKTATPSFDRTYDWTVDKTVDPDTLNLFDGDTGTATWSITPHRGAAQDSNWNVTGTITVTNPTGDPDGPIHDDISATVNSVEDVIDGSIDVGADGTLTCPTFPVTLGGGESLECTYSYTYASDPGAGDHENVATANIDISDTDTMDYSGSSMFNFASATPTVTDDTATLTDARLSLNQAAQDGVTVDVEETFACPTDEGTEDNTARVTEDDSGAYDEDSASVTINCYDLSVSKTAIESRTRTYNWTIDKSVVPATWDLFTGDTGTSEYTVAVTKTGFTDSAWHVSGEITVTNNHPSMAADLTGVADSISGFGAVTVVCPSLTVPAGGSLVCTYETDLPDGSSRTNTATATQQNYDYDADGIASAGGTTDYQGQADIDFSEAVTTEVNATINVDDTNGGSWSFGDTGSVQYSRTFACDADEGQHDNTATIVETGQSDSASVQVNCYQLSVSKDADESYTRTYDWNIDKSADQDSLTLMPGETFPVNYSVTVDVAGYTDSAWHVDGNITIHNNHPSMAADLTGVADVIFDGISASVNCPSLTVPAGGDLVCTYSSDLPDATTRLNTATATQQNYDYDKDLVATADGTTDYSGNANVEFGDPTEFVDECVDVSDSIVGFLGTACVGDAPATFNYSMDFGPYTDADCGEFDVPNTADFITNDTGATGEDFWNVHITVPCPEGCTLTQGYWKTHNEEFWGGAPEDPNWYLIGDFDEDGISEGPNEDFFDTGMTWFEVFWENVAGRPYYQLAHQWMAAYLNTLSIQAIGGSIPADVQDALDQGAILLETYEHQTDLKGKGAKDIRDEFTYYAGILGDFNEGTIGPGHCDEPIVVTSTSSLPSSGLVFALPLGLLAPVTEFIRRRKR